jgi:hypothetical protein
MFIRLEGFKMITRDTLSTDYLDWVNNYLSVELFAEHRGLTVAEAKMLIALGTLCFENNHPEA